MNVMIEISIQEWARLVERDQELSLLEAYGVDNWEGYYDALNDVEGYGGENGDK